MSDDRATRVCVVRQGSITFDPRVRREVGALLSAGHEVDVVSARDDGGRLRERDGRLTVYRVPTPGGNGVGGLAYLLRSAWFLLAASVLLTVLHLRRRYALVQVHSLPDTLVFAALVPKLLGARVVLDLHELMVEFAQTRLGESAGGRLRPAVAAAEQASIRFADLAITCTDEMRETFVARGADPDRVGVVLNAADEEVFDVTRHPPRGSGAGTFVVLCHGTVEERYGIDTAIEAVALLAAELPGLRLDVMGRGAYLEEARALAQARGVAHRVGFNDRWVPIEELLDAIAACDAGLVAMKRDPFRDLTHCNKMYDLVTMRRPVLMSRTRSVQASFGEDCFEYFDSGDAAGLAAAIRRLHDDPDRRAALVEAAAVALEPLRWPRQREAYLGYVDGVLRSTISPASSRA